MCGNHIILHLMRSRVTNPLSEEGGAVVDIIVGLVSRYQE